jgi:uncharacterized delta-60 repeat protein
MPTPTRSLRCEPLEDRLTPTAGGFDPTFGTGGKAVLPLGDSFGASAAALTADQHILVAGSAANSFAVARLTQSGALDSTFGTNGQAQIAFTDFGAGTLSHTAAVLAQPDGKIVLIGTVSAGPSGPEESVLGLARLNADGTPDQTFGTGGKTTVSLHLGTLADFESLNAAVLQPDGRIVAAGGAMAASPTGPGGTAVGMSELLVARFTPTGQLDAGFGAGGIQTAAFTPTSNTHSEANAVALMPDGRIVAAGDANTSGSNQQAVVIRLTPDGQFDPLFDTDGKAVVSLPLGGDQAGAKSLAVQPDGSVLLAGSFFTGGPSRAFVTRLTPTGQRDATFAVGNFVPFIFPSAARGNVLGNNVTALLLQSNGQVIVAGAQEDTATSNYDQHVTRLNPDGTIDLTFADNGGRQVAFDLGGTNADFVASALLQADGNIVVVGSAADGTGNKPVAFRLLGDRPVPTPGTVLAGGPADGSATLLTASNGTYQVGAGVSFFPGFGGDVRTATADVNGDGVPDYVGGSGPGGGPRVVVIDGKTGARLADFFAFESSFTGGVFVSAANINGDGKADVIVTPDQGGGPVVAVFDGAKLAAGRTADAAQITRFLGIDDAAFRGGARPALADVNGDGQTDLLVAAGYLGGPRVALYDGSTVGSGTPVKLVPDFFAFEDGLRNGAFVAAGDLTGDGQADLFFGAGPGGAPRVRAFDAAKLLAAGSFSNLDAIVSTAQVANFFAGDTASRGGVRLTTRDSDGDGKADLIAGSGEGEPARVRVYKGSTLAASATPGAAQTLDLFGGATLTGGVFVG